MFKIEPTEDHVAVKLDTLPTKIGSIVLPDIAKTANGYVFGHVVAVGPGSRYQQVSDNGDARIIERLNPPSVGVGDRVILNAYAANDPIEVDAVKIVVVSSHSILAVVKE